MELRLLIGVVLAYLIGSIPTSVWIGKIFHGIDVRDYGSGNAGATNTFRVLGAKAGIPVFFLDALKGWLAIRIAFLAWNVNFNDIQLANFQMALGVAAVLGHVFPIWANFKGGKGVATLLGVITGLYPEPMLIVLGLFLLVFLTTEYVSLGSIIAAVAFPFIVIFIYPGSAVSLVVFSILIGIFIPLTHRKNINRLLKGEENKIHIWHRRNQR